MTTVAASPEILPRIFDPFVTSKRGQGGSGLGTHIIYNLVVQLLRGRIHCASEPGQAPSSTFVCPSSRTEHRLLWAGRFVPIML